MKLPQIKGREVSYDERLFGGGLRAQLHLARFRFLVRTVRALGLRPRRVIELGCYNGRALDTLCAEVGAPDHYLGLDANWGGGLFLAMQKYADTEAIALRTCQRPEEIPEGAPPFDLGICLETLEHVAPELVEPYLERLSRAVRGHFIFTGPIERGPVFVGRHLPKLLIRQENLRYSAGDFVFSAIGRLDRVKRSGHIGYDDRLAIRQIGKYFEILSVDGIVPGIRPYSLNFQFGVVAKSKAATF